MWKDDSELLKKYESKVTFSYCVKKILVYKKLKDLFERASCLKEPHWKTIRYKSCIYFMLSFYSIIKKKEKEHKNTHDVNNLF